jgi:eukaryotic-like serine/threonine-protein kinase
MRIRQSNTNNLLDFFMVGSLLMGGLTCTRHFFLRLLLYRDGSIPWNYSRFLDYTVSLALLRRVGGGYIFTHRLLLEHFAATDSEVDG